MVETSDQGDPRSMKGKAPCPLYFPPIPIGETAHQKNQSPQTAVRQFSDRLLDLELNNITTKVIPI